MKATQPNLNQFKSWSRKHKGLAIAVCAAKACSEVTRERVDAYIAPVFASFGFQYSGTMADKLKQYGPIPSPEQLYLCEDPRIPDFYAACDVEHKRQGFDLPAGYCPALVAETELIKAENALIEAAEPLFHLGVHQVHFENRRKYLDLLIGACIKS